MNVRRFALGAIIALPLLALIGAWPALAAFPPVVSLETPADNTTWTSGSSTDFHVKGQANTDSGDTVTRVTVSAKSLEDDARPAYTEVQNWPSEDGLNSQRSFDISIFPDINGPYRLTVQASGKECGFIFGCQSESHGPQVVRTLTLAVPPATPTGAKASVGPDGKATVEWNANNTEADLLGYLIERTPPGGVYTCVGSVPRAATPPSVYKFTDTLGSLPDGKYTWRIRAVRRSNNSSVMSTSAKAGTGLLSAGATTDATWTNPNPTTTTTAKPGSTTSTTRRSGSSTGGGGGGGTSGGGGGGGGGGHAARRPNLATLGGLGVPNNLARTPSRLPNEVDSGFNELLPFQPGGSESEGGQDALADSPAQAADESNGTTTLLYIAAGLLATVLSMHVLWLKAQVDRMPLEPLPPAELPLT